MRYFENRFEGILERFRFSLRMYREDKAHCEQCYQESLGEMESLFNRHDCHDSFSKRLMDCKNSYQRRLKKEYLGI